jgi:hypothetical protein
MTAFVDKLIVPAMKGRGPVALPTIYRKVRKQARMKHYKLSKHWRATVRNTLQRHCPDSDKCFDRKLFIHHDAGVWEHNPANGTS